MSSNSQTQDEQQWSVNLVRDRYNYLSLSYEQAEKVYKYEQERDTYSDRHYFSQWEEWDFESTEFREILEGEQYIRYQNFQKESIDSYIGSLIELDSKMQNEILFNQELINYYEKKLLPDLCSNHFLKFGFLHSDPTKIEYLRMEYKRFLNDAKKEILTSHFRHNRTYRPNQLKVSLLQHKLSCMLPDYYQFQHKMDLPTKAVAEYLMTKVSNLPAETEDLLSRKFSELMDFNNSNFKKYFGEIGGWHVFGRLSPEDEKIQRIMRVMLIDRSK